MRRGCLYFCCRPCGQAPVKSSRHGGMGGLGTQKKKPRTPFRCALGTKEWAFQFRTETLAVEDIGALPFGGGPRVGTESHVKCAPREPWGPEGRSKISVGRSFHRRIFHVCGLGYRGGRMAAGSGGDLKKYPAKLDRH